MLAQKKTSIKGLLLYECKNGFYQSRFQLLFGMALLLFVIHMSIQDLSLLNYKEITFGDCWFYLCSGSREYIHSSESKFELPIIWFLFHVYILYAVCSYPVNDLDELGIQSMILSKSRITWIVAKVSWTFLTILVFYITAFLFLGIEIFIQDLCFGKQISYDLTSSMVTTKWIVFYVLPCLSDIAIAMFQLLVSFLFQPFTAYIFTVSYLILSAYLKNPFLLGNYSMLLRSQTISENGLSPEFGIFICFLCIIICVFLCMWHIKTKDMIGKRMEM